MTTDQDTGDMMLVIEDNGCGMPDDITFGNGLSHLAKRIEALGGGLFFHRVDPSGTGVVITLPLR
jgi:signal transduction histidine kinase